MRNTILLIVIAALLGAYVYFYEIKGGEKREKEKALAEKLFNVKKDSVNHILIEKKTQTIELKKKDDAWYLLQPVETMADEGPVNALLYSIESTKKIRTFKAQAKDLNTYGLGKGSTKVTFSGKGIDEQWLKIGDRTPVGGNIFVTKNDSDIVIVSSSLKNNVNKSLFDWRDKKVIHFKKEKVKEFTLKNKYGRFHFVKEDGVWKLTEPVNTPADESKINAVLNKLQYGRITGVAAETPKNLAHYGLKNPAYRIELFTGVEKARLGLSLSRLKGNEAYGKDDSRPHIFKVDSFFVKPFNKNLFGFREKFFSKFKRRSEVDRIQLLHNGSLMIFEKDSVNNWHLSTGERAKNWKISNLMSNVSNLKAVRYVKDNPKTLKPYGLDRPQGKIEIFAGEDKLVELLIGKEKGDNVYAYNPSFKAVALVAKSNLKKLFPEKEELLEKKPEKKKEKKTTEKK